MSKLLCLVLALGTMVAAQAGQHVVSGTVRDFDGKPIAGAKVDFKSTSFDDLHSTKTDANGHYSLTVEDGLYQAVTIVRPEDWAKTRVEFWAWNVPVKADMTLDARYHRMEIYGISVFRVQGAAPGLMAYFRAMSLTRYLAVGPGKEPEKTTTSPADLDLAIEVNGVPATIDTVERVPEYLGKGAVMYGLLVHFTPKGPYDQDTDVIHFMGKDKVNDDQGEAVYYRVKPAYR